MRFKSYEPKTPKPSRGKHIHQVHPYRRYHLFGSTSVDLSTYDPYSLPPPLRLAKAVERAVKDAAHHTTRNTPLATRHS